MKKLIFAAFFSFLFSSTQAQSVGCTEVTIGVTFGFSASTTVYVCCGGPFMSYPNPCSVVSKKTYDLWTNSPKSLVSKPSGRIAVKDLAANSKVDISKLTFIEITESSKAKMEDGKTISIKKGKYPITDGMVQLEIEIL